MNRQYNLKYDQESKTTYATFTKDNAYYEVPAIGSEADVQLAMDQAILNTAISMLGMYQLRDDVWCDRQIVRQDYTLGTVEGAELLANLQTEFPNEFNYSRSNMNVLGSYDGYRAPYQNPSISWYDFGVKPSESLLLDYGTSYPTSNLKEWYGLKFDLVTREIILKVVINNYEGPSPMFPEGNTFYAITHMQDGTTSDWVDAYVYATPKRVRQFCDNKGLTYPLPEDEHKKCDVVWCWGFVFNKNTLEYGAVKAYARYKQG